MQAFLLSAAFLSIVYAVVFVLERRPKLAFRPLSYRRRYFLTDLTWYGIVVGMSALSILLVRPVFDRLTIEPIANIVRDLPVPARFVLALLLFDLVAYAVHRALHQSDLLWNLHKVHHSSLELDGVAATRQHVMENMIRFLPSQLAMFLVGIPTAQVAPAVALGAVFAIVEHSNLRLDVRWLEKIVITPRLHRRHHVPATSMTNYGGVFSIWDRMFGSFVSMDTAPEERFGCPGEVDTYPQRFKEAVRKPPRDIAAQLRSRRRPTATTTVNPDDAERVAA